MLPRAIFLLGVLPFLAAQVLVEIQSFPQNAVLFHRGERVPPFQRLADSTLYTLPEGEQRLTLSAYGYQPSSFTLTISRAGQVHRTRLFPQGSPLTFLGEVKTGSQPKSVRFTPDGRHLIVTLLNDTHCEVFQVRPLQRVAKLEFLGFGQQRGFVESWILPKRNELWISQMTTSQVHVFRLDDFTYRESFSTKGLWPKVILVDRNEKWGYVSNWSSNNVSVIDVEKRQVIRLIPTPGTPRGLALSPDERVLYVANFEQASVQRYSLPNFEELPAIRVGSFGAMRHLVVQGHHLYASDMATGRVYRFNALRGEFEAELPLGLNLNTIDVAQNSSLLFASSRGRNNPESYLLVGPEYGKVFVVDANRFTLMGWVWGRNQPTGLSVSPDCRLVAFTDFLSDNLELFAINKWEE